MKVRSDSTIKQYISNQENYRTLVDYVDYLLHKSIENYKIKIHSITNRIKEIDSILKKMRRKHLSNPFEEMHDVVGFRVVCLFLEDLDEIGRIIKKEFRIFDENNKVHDKELDIFGYMSLHFKAKLRESFEEPPNQSIKEIPFEIQVRTISQDAWASISHYLDYKKENIISDELKRDFYALSGLFYVADTHFRIIRGRQQSKQSGEKPGEDDSEAHEQATTQQTT
jgi:putative GTP pyrophosphokinase